jgi:CrcB protein
MIKSIFLVALGGAFGSVLRFVIQRYTPIFPMGTLLVNITGCFLIGLLWGMFHKSIQGDSLKLLLMTGFCGGFTTFSAFTLESIQLLEENKWWSCLMYITGSVAGGLLATFGGYKITN